MLHLPRLSRACFALPFSSGHIEKWRDPMDQVKPFPVVAEFEVPEETSQPAVFDEDTEAILLRGDKTEKDTQKIAHALAICSGFAYADWQTFGRAMAWLGLEGATGMMLEE